MKKVLFFVILLVSVNLNAQNKNKLTVFWNNGINAQTDNKNFSFKAGGRIQYDVMFINESDSLQNYFPQVNGSEFRRARLYTKGTIYKNIKYKFQVDFAHGKVVLKDVYIQLSKIPAVGNLRIGHFKEPFGMVMMTSSNFITMMERPLSNQFDFDRSLGFMIFNHHFDKRLSWFAGYFHPDHNHGVFLGKQYDLTFRVFGLPVFINNDKYRILHIGAGYSYHYVNDKVVYKTRPEAHLAPKYIHLDIDKLSHYNSFKGELALVAGSFSFEGEYTLLDVILPDSSKYSDTHYSFNTYFATVSWFITGEHKNYNLKKGAFDRVHPKNNFGSGKGFGALEIALRYSNINLNNADIIGGQMGNLTAGLNWYLNPVVKFAFNYIRSNVQSFAGISNTKGIANIYQMRFQLTF